MKKIYLILLVAATAVFSFSSCQKDDLPNGTFSATMDNLVSRDSKVVYDGAFTWQANDEIRVYRLRGSNASFGKYKATVSQSNSATFAYESETDVTADQYSGNFHALYPYSIGLGTSWITLNNNQINEFAIKLPDSYSTDNSGHLIGNPMYTWSVNKQLTFHHLCGLLRFRLTKNGAHITSIRITAGSTSTPNGGIINGNFKVSAANNSLTLAGTTTSDDRRTVELVIPGSQDISTQKDFFIPLPPGTYSDLIIDITEQHGSVCTKTQTSGRLTIVRGMYSTITLGEDDLSFAANNIEGAIDGVFTINSNGDQVRFSKGNLQYLAYDNNTTNHASKWRFAENQWAVIGNTPDNINPSNTSTTWIDFFGWGTSGEGTAYPWNHGTSETYGPASGGFDVDGDQSFDWGYHNSIENGGGQAGQWRTLKSSEWSYLVGNTDERRDKWARATVNNVTGLILLPNSWNATVPSNRGSNSTYDNNTYSGQTWTDLENSGAVFLPSCGGYRSGSTFKSNDIVRYWASDVYNSAKSYYFYYNTSRVTTASANKYLGYYVRLVHDI